MSVVAEDTVVVASVAVSLVDSVFDVVVESVVISLAVESTAVKSVDVDVVTSVAVDGDAIV